MANIYENLSPVRLKIDSPEEKKFREALAQKDDPDSLRLTRFLALADLTREKGHPIHELAERIFAIPEFKGFDHIAVPDIVRADASFDLFNFPPDHPARSKSDTYFVTDDYILRTHTTVMWYYYMHAEEIKKKVKENQPLGILCTGKVYRKDEIDRFHLNVFHQMDGMYLHPTTDKKLGIETLKDILGKIAQAVFGPETKYRFNEDTFPYTDPSLEMEIEKNGKWLEVLGGGMVRTSVLAKLGVDENQYTGWAFGFGMERLAIISMELPDIRLLRSTDPRVTKQLVLGKPFKEVSKFPPITRDISFVVKSDFEPNRYFDLIRDEGGDLIEEVALLDKYADEKKFGAGRTSYTYRVVYRSNERTLVSEEIDAIQKKIYEETAKQFQAEMR